MIRDALDKIRGYLDPSEEPPDYALVLSGGGARASYQAGVLRFIAEAFPDANFSIMTGVSAGALNTAYLADHAGPLPEACAHLLECWREIQGDDVFATESSVGLLWKLLRRGGTAEEAQGVGAALEHGRGLVDTAPLRVFLEDNLQTEEGRLVGVTENLRTGRLKAFAVTTTNYMTGQTVTWVQGDHANGWERPGRISISTILTVDHILASTALPLLFPAVQIGGAWYGDGGIRLSSPLSPAIHLGADRLLIISTRYARSRAEADEPSIHGYPPAAQILGILMNAIFLDLLDQDVVRLERFNKLLAEMPPRKRLGMRPIEALVIRPSQDLGKLASEYELKVTGALKMLTMGLGAHRTKSPDWLSMLLFESSYIEHLIEIGYADARRQVDDLAAFLEQVPRRAPAQPPTEAARGEAA